VFGNRKARKQEQAERHAAVDRLRGMAETLPDENGEVSPERFQRFLQVVIDNDISLSDYPDIRDPVLLGLAAGGCFLQQNSTLILHGDEVAIWETTAQLLKEVASKQFRGGSQGLSIPLGHGVRYRVGQVRGHVDTIDTHWETADSGPLTVTDRRIVFHGRRKTLEFLFAKLATLNVYADAIDLGVTNRQTTSSFRLHDPELVAGMIQAALARVDDEVTVIRLKAEQPEPSSTAEGEEYLVECSNCGEECMAVSPDDRCWKCGQPVGG
jgi:hypothetical protein